MKLVKQKRLHFQQGASDKVYEVDLCEVGTDEYLVNFRYGRRGATLTEGTKTVSPVDREKADKLFNKLVEEKSKKGYVDVSEDSLEEQAEQVEETKAEKIAYATPEEAQEANILSHLALAARSLDLQAKKNWDIKRVIWRAGELKLQAAVPHLIRLASLSQLGKRKNELYQYCVLWALGRCAADAGSDKEVLELIDNMRKSEKSDEQTKRIAAEAYLMVAKGEARQNFLADIKGQLSAEFQAEVDKDDYRGVRRYLLEAKSKNNGMAVLSTIYLLAADKKGVRQALLDILGDLPLQAGYFKYIRHIFKTAEFREDGEVYGLLAYRIEKQSPGFKMPGGENPSMYHSRQYLYPKSELKKSDSKLAFSNKTKEYLQRRIRRTMKRFGEAGNLNYVRLATGILLNYDDTKDGKTGRVAKDWKYDENERRWQSTVSYFDSYSKELIFNEILYANSSRYAYSKRYNEWVCANNYQPGDAIDEKVREEAFPELWDQMPKALLHLLIEAKSEKVTDFALRSLKRHSEYKNYIARFDMSLIIKLLEKPFAIAYLFALELANQRYDAEKPDTKLVLAMLNHADSRVREQALAWVSQSYFLFFTDTDFVRDLLTHPEGQVRNWARENFNRIADLYDENKQRALIGRLMGYCLRGPMDEAIVLEIKNLLLKYFSTALSQLSLDVIGDLLNHSSLINKQFAAELLQNHSIDADRIPMENILTLINSKEETLRQAGLNLMGKMSEIALAKQLDLLLSLLVSNTPEIRAAIRPIIANLATKYEAFAKTSVAKLLKLLLRKESFEGLHNEVYSILSIDLEQWLNIVDRQLIFRLLNSDHSKAQELACILIDKYVPFSSLSVRNIIRLADHEILQARQLAWRMFEEQLPRVKYEREEAVRMMDCNWEDSRQFAFGFFRKEFTETDWTPELMVSICDSVRPDVQAFGRELITRFFNDEDGPEYLLKLSQHPRHEVQLFATNYLTRFASDNIYMIKRLETYFMTVLSNVNKGRVAKDRILMFLHKEAMKAYEAAEVTARVIAFISATDAKEDKATCIEIMRDIIKKYPVLELPLTVNEHPEYSK